MFRGFESHGLRQFFYLPIHCAYRLVILALNRLKFKVPLREKSRTCLINCLILQLEEWLDHPQALAKKSLDTATKNLLLHGASMFAGASRG